MEPTLTEIMKRKAKPEKKRVSIYVKKITWDEVDKVAKKYKTPVSEAAEELIEEGLRELNNQETKKLEGDKN